MTNELRTIPLSNQPTIPVADQTDVGSYFVANYPPFSVWSSEAVKHDAIPALAQKPKPGVRLGL